MEKVINKWKINKSLLASKMGMPLGTFCNKLSSKHETTFSDAELIKLKIILKEMAENITVAAEIDFDDALAVLVKKQKP